MKPSIDDLIRNTETINGPIVGVATLAQKLKSDMREGRNWDNMAPEAKELLEQAATQIARILSGDANDATHWNGAAACFVLRALALGEARDKGAVEISSLERRMRTISPAPDSTT